MKMYFVQVKVLITQNEPFQSDFCMYYTVKYYG